MIKRVGQSSNLTATPGCSDPECLLCIIRVEGDIQYKLQLECRLCLDTDKSLYIGETSRNTRGLEHQAKYEGRKEDSFMCKHQRSMLASNQFLMER